MTNLPSHRSVRMNIRLVFITLLITTLIVVAVKQDIHAQSTREDSPVTRNVLLPPGPDNPRNSEGDFIRLKDGRLMFIYTHFTGGGGDHEAAHLAARYSCDEVKPGLRRMKWSSRMKEG